MRRGRPHACPRRGCSSKRDRIVEPSSKPICKGASADAVKAALKPIYPQLADFDVEHNVSPDHLWITYKYRTTRSKRPGGWTAQVPNPESGGVWFYIDFHDHDSTSQIHTQPFTGRFAFRNKRVSFLMLEGPKTKSLQPAIWKILREHGVESLPL